MKKLLLFALLLAAFWNPVSAQSTSDLGSWVSIQAVKSFGKPYAMARLEHRSYDNVSATECWFAMAGGGYRFAPWLSADLSYEYWKLPIAGNVTTQKAVACVSGTLAREGLSVTLREKYELAFAEDGSSSGTLRSRLRAQYRPSDSRLTPYVMYEHFLGSDGFWQRSLHYFGTEFRFADHHSLDFFYMYHLYPRGGDLACCHVLGIGYYFTF